MKAKHIRLVGDSQRDFARRCIAEAPVGWVVKIGAETRRDAQNRKLWPMIADIQAQVPKTAAFTADDVKMQFLNALGVEMRFLPTLEGEGMFPVGMKSSTLTVQQFAGLIELLYEYGARHGVQWSDDRSLAA